MVARQLEYLVALAREGHFGRAAVACHVSQPALSTGIQRLEDELGVTLIRRGRRFEGLTAEGEALLPWARAALASLDGIVTEASHLRGDLAGTLRIGHIPTVAARVGDLLGPFGAEHPGVRVVLSTEPTVDLLRRIQDHELDAGLLYVDDGVPDAFHVVRLYRDRLLLLTSDPRWPGAGSRAGAAPMRGLGREVTWAQAAELPLCLLAPVMQNRQIIDAAFAEAGVAPRPHMEADSVSALVELGLSGGSCIVASAWIRGRTLPEGAHVHELVDPVAAPTVGLVTRAGPLASPAARLLRDALSATRLPG